MFIYQYVNRISVINLYIQIVRGGGGDTGCGKWDYRGEKNVGSGTIGVKKFGK